MKLVLTTTYHDIDDEFVEWYIKRLRMAPELDSVADQLQDFGRAEFKSKDPTSSVHAVTEYVILEK